LAIAQFFGNMLVDFASDGRFFSSKETGKEPTTTTDKNRDDNASL